MASPIAQFRVWDNAKEAARKFQYDEAIALYRNVEADMKNLHKWRASKTERDNLFDQALFFGDFCGVLAGKGLYTEAKAKGDLALKFIEKSGFTTTVFKYIYYNIGNIYLFQQEYAQACEWFEKSLEGATYFYTSVNNYLVNYGISLYFLGMTDKAKEKFELAISSSKGTKYNNNFEPSFYMWKICELRNEKKESQKYRKMYLIRLKKYSQIEIEWATSTMEDRKEILTDYAKK